MELPTWKGAYCPRHVNPLSMRLFNHARGVIDCGITYSVARVLGMTRAGMTEVLGFKFQWKTPIFFSQSECSFSMLRNFWGAVRPFFNDAALRVLLQHMWLKVKILISVPGSIHIQTSESHDSFFHGLWFQILLQKLRDLKVLLHILSVVNILNIAYSPRPMSYLL